MFYVHHSAGWGWGWWVLMTLGMIAFWAALVYGIVWFVRSGRPVDDRRQSAPEPPEEILKRRLAAGDITLEQYERLLDAVLDRSRDPVAASGPAAGRIAPGARRSPIDARDVGGQLNDLMGR